MVQTDSVAAIDNNSSDGTVATVQMQNAGPRAVFTFGSYWIEIGSGNLTQVSMTNWVELAPGESCRLPINVATGVLVWSVLA